MTNDNAMWALVKFVKLQSTADLSVAILTVKDEVTSNQVEIRFGMDDFLSMIGEAVHMASAIGQARGPHENRMEYRRVATTVPTNIAMARQSREGPLPEIQVVCSYGPNFAIGFQLSQEAAERLCELSSLRP